MCFELVHGEEVLHSQTELKICVHLALGQPETGIIRVFVGITFDVFSKEKRCLQPQFCVCIYHLSFHPENLEVTGQLRPRLAVVDKRGLKKVRGNKAIACPTKTLLSAGERGSLQPVLSLNEALENTHGRRAALTALGAGHLLL